MNLVSLPQPNYSFVFLDHTTSATPSAMKPAPVFQKIIDALLEQINGPYAASHGAVTANFRVGSGPEDRAPGEIAVNFRDTIPEAPDALAYHRTTNGVPDIEIGVDLFSSLTEGSESMSGGVSHEILELCGDAGANEWADLQDVSGQTRARENCDAVQNTGYEASNGVWVSNFVLPSYYIPQAPGPWDALGVMTSQTDVSHGYEIRATAPTDISQVQGLVQGHVAFGEHVHHGKRVFAIGTLTAQQKKRKSHPYCRTHRRGVRL